MKELDVLLKRWEWIQSQIRELTDQKKKIEHRVIEIMKDTKWDTYKSQENITVSLTEEEISEIDRSQLKLFLNKEDIETVTKHRLEKHLVIITPESRKGLTKVLRGMK